MNRETNFIASIFFVSSDTDVRRVGRRSFVWDVEEGVQLDKRV
jgi:hypothetical protein